jgi:hypothetical protein
MHQQLIIEKISGILEATDDTYDVKLTEMLDNAKRIFYRRRWAFQASWQFFCDETGTRRL